MTAFDEVALADALGAAQRLGFVGRRPIPEAIEHSRAVARALDGVIGTVVDLGAGGGLPGLVIAHDRPDLSVQLVDRRAKRTDFLERMVRRYGLESRVSVRCCDVQIMQQERERGSLAPFDAAVARGFGPPDQTLRFMVALVRPGGRFVVTEPPSGDRWDPDLVRDLDLVRRDGPHGVAVFESIHSDRS